MIYVFIDTNVYIGAGYNLKNNFFSAIEKFSNNGDVKLLTCSICENEVKLHIKTDVENIIKEINKNIDIGLFFAIRNDERYKDRYLTVDDREIEESLIKGYRDYLRRVNAESFSIEGICVEELMTDYFKMNPPFEPQKRAEFKDAIMIKALKLYQKGLGQQIHILSQDKGFRAAFADDNNFIIYDYYKKFMQYILRREEVCWAFETYCQDKDLLIELEDIIRDYLRDCEYYNYDRPEFEVVNSAEVEDLSLEFLYCEIESEEKAKVHILTDAIIEINAIYLDEENSCYDHEKKEYFFKSYLDVKEQHHVQIEAILDAEYGFSSAENNMIEKYECEILNVNEEESGHIIELQENTIIETISCGEHIPLSQRKWYIENSVYCRQCGKRIGFDGVASNFTYNEEPLCDGCMQDDKNGFVCPNCSYKEWNVNIVVDGKEEIS